MKKGFTLIEVLAVIVLLGVISIIAYPISNNIIKDSKESALKETITNLENIGYLYSSENNTEHSTEETPLLFSTLKDLGYIKNDLTNINKAIENGASKIICEEKIIVDIPGLKENGDYTSNVALKLANKNNIALILLDGVEKLSKDNRDAVYNRCKKAGVQIIATRTTDDNVLTVSKI